MIKRLVWLTTGILIGWGSVLWMVRTVKQTARRYVPERVSREAAATARRVSRDVREAVAEGRAEARATEARMRARLGGPADTDR